MCDVVCCRFSFFLSSFPIPTSGVMLRQACFACFACLARLALLVNTLMNKFSNISPSDTTRPRTVCACLREIFLVGKKVYFDFRAGQTVRKRVDSQINRCNNAFQLIFVSLKDFKVNILFVFVFVFQAEKLSHFG